jgi:membrane protease YdiL (CAAX protease family)
MNNDTATNTYLAPNWRQVSAFLGLTFGLTWLLDLAIYLRGGLQIPGIAIFTQLQTLLPAFSAILLGLFFFTESPIYHSRPARRGRWFYYYFLLMTVVYALGALNVFLNPAQNTITIAAAILQILTMLGLILLIVMRFISGHEAMAQVWLAWGNVRYWLLFGLGFVVYYALQAALNAVSGLGGTGSALPGIHSPILLVLAGVQTVLLTPLLAILVFFGEELGWRGYLQSELFKLGRVRGVLLVGLIWGAWHWPVILMGVNYPGHPLLGVLLNTLNTIGLAVVLGYAVLESGSVLLAAYLHGITDQVINFIVALGFRPHDPAFSFGIGIYGILMLAIVALLILRDPIWRQKSSNESSAFDRPRPPSSASY